VYFKLPIVLYSQSFEFIVIFIGRLVSQAKAAECVQHLVEDFESAQHRVRQAGALPCLLSLIEELLPSAAAAAAIDDDDENTVDDTKAAASVVPLEIEETGIAAVQHDALTAALWAVNNLVAHNGRNQVRSSTSCSSSRDIDF
jgi:hypothetical protein